jgi:hypothetical protein
MALCASSQIFQDQQLLCVELLAPDHLLNDQLDERLQAKREHLVLHKEHMDLREGPSLSRRMEELLSRHWKHEEQDSHPARTEGKVGNSNGKHLEIHSDYSVEFWHRSPS